MDYTHYVGIKFSNNGKGYYFATDIADLQIGEKVVAEPARGIQLGEVTSLPVEISKYKSELELKPVLRRATKDDEMVYQENIKKAKEAFKIAIQEINNLELEMHPIETEYSLDGAKLTIAYTADDRVDFRELLKILAYRFHCRIELRQVGSRDKAKMVGGIGLCGLPLCCSSFITTMEGISINRAKNQMLSLNIPKLSGHCGKLICCLLYEDDAYTDLKKNFPPIGTMYEQDGVEFKLSSFNVISNVVKLENENEVRYIPHDDLKNYKKLNKYEKPKFSEQ